MKMYRRPGLPGPLEAERQALLRVLDNGLSACPDCETVSHSVTWRPVAQCWRVSVEHSRSGCAVKRNARARRAYLRWLSDQLAAVGARVEHYRSTADLDVSHR